MSKISVDQSPIGELFSNKKSDFLIPDYQRPYAWGIDECQTLWADIWEFAFPDNNKDKFKTDDEYYLGPIDTFENDERKLEVIDGQQRLTTLMLLLRAFYDKFLYAQNPDTIKTRDKISTCIWKTDEYDNPDFDKLKINSEVATDDDKEAFLYILKNGKSPENNHSNYAENFDFFTKKIEEYAAKFDGYTSLLAQRIMNNCIVLPIEADNQDTALRIFSTLNDRGLPLSDADIFKAQFYKYYSDKGKKDDFIEVWKGLEELSEKIFHPSNGTPMDELFTRYMYFERAKQGIKSSTTEALRKFYEKDKYALLKNDATLDNLVSLAQFWNAVDKQDTEKFSPEVLRKLFVLNYAPNGMWTAFVSVYYMQNRDNKGKLEDKAFYAFLEKLIAFVWAYAFTNPGVNALRTPLYAEMINIVNDRPVDFSDYKINEEQLTAILSQFEFINQRPITKSMLTWWAFENPKQDIVELDTKFEIEHIFAKNRQENDVVLNNPKNIECLGNKSLLEKRINIRASDFRFKDKYKYYNGFTTASGKEKEKTAIVDLINLSNTQTEFTESDIVNRNKKILDAFVAYVKANKLM